MSSFVRMNVTISVSDATHDAQDEKNGYNLNNLYNMNSCRPMRSQNNSKSTNKTDCSFGNFQKDENFPGIALYDKNNEDGVNGRIVTGFKIIFYIQSLNYTGAVIRFNRKITIFTPIILRNILLNLKLSLNCSGPERDVSVNNTVFSEYF